jgi:drug/metabolite transporter (DMT)-like permease
VAGPLFDATVVACIASVAFGLISQEVDLVPHWPSHGWLFGLALTSQVVGWLLISTSLPRLPAALISMLLLVQPVGALALGAVVLEEDPSPVQLLGAGLILVGVLFASSGHSRSGIDEPPFAEREPELARDIAPIAEASR